VLHFVRKVSEVWHSTDSVIYLLRTIEEQKDEIQWLRHMLEALQNSNVQQVEETFSSHSDAKEYKPVGKGREPWSVIQGRIHKEELKKARENAQSIAESSD
jgi:hypothetical protein